MEVRTGGAPGAAGEGDDVSRLHVLSHSRQKLRAVTVQRNESVAVVDAYVVAVASGVVLGDRHRSRQRGADECAGGDCQVHAGVSLALPSDGIDAVAEFRGDAALPARADWRTETVRADKWHIHAWYTAPGASLLILCNNSSEFFGYLL